LNLISPGVAFSEKYATQVGLRIEKLKPLAIGTAGCSYRVYNGSGRRREEFTYEDWSYRGYTSSLLGVKGLV